VRPVPADGSFVLIAAAATLACAAFAWNEHRLIEAKSHWPKTPGVIGRAGAEPFLLGYRPSLEYAYVAGGQRRAGQQVLRPGWFGSKQALDGFITRHAIGAAIDVHVDPSDPGSSWVSAGADYSGWWPFSSALGVFLASICLLLTLAFATAYVAKKRELEKLARRRR